mmetsp:Transcript_50555/g.70125  ORF Transcript_50555/g.70125 Transcript_50555/m.70125 type:complete len:302 (+) Transcript_50555:631-1536(+)
MAVNMRPNERRTTKRHTPALPGKLAWPRLQKELGEAGEPSSEPLLGDEQSLMTSSRRSTGAGTCTGGQTPPMRSLEFSSSSSRILRWRRSLCSLLSWRASEMSLMSSCFFWRLSLADSLFMILLLYDLKSASSSAVRGLCFSISAAMVSICSQVMVFSWTLEMRTAVGTCFARFLFLFAPVAALAIFLAGFVSTPSAALALLLVLGGEGALLTALSGEHAGEAAWASSPMVSRNRGWKRSCWHTPSSSGEKQLDSGARSGLELGTTCCGDSSWATRFRMLESEAFQRSCSGHMESSESMSV